MTGRVTVDAEGGGETYRAHVTASIDTRTITTDIGVRDAAMRSTFLRTDQFPAITFAGAVTAHPGLGIRPFPATASGSLTIRDVTREIEFPATVTALAREYTVEASTPVRMADYEIPYPRMFVFAARDPVTVILHIRARALGARAPSAAQRCPLLATSRRCLTVGRQSPPPPDR